MRENAGHYSCVTQHIRLLGHTAYCNDPTEDQHHGRGKQWVSLGGD